MYNTTYDVPVSVMVWPCVHCGRAPTIRYVCDVYHIQCVPCDNNVGKPNLRDAQVAWNKNEGEGWQGG